MAEIITWTWEEKAEDTASQFPSRSAKLSSWAETAPVEYSWIAKILRNRFVKDKIWIARAGGGCSGKVHKGA